MKATPHVLVFSDSIGFEYAGMLQKVLARRMSDPAIVVQNEGVPGETSAEGVQRLAHTTTDGCNVVVIHFGMNDWRLGESPQVFGENLRRMTRHFLGLGIRVVLATITPDWNARGFAGALAGKQGISPEIKIFNRVVREIAQAEKVRWADPYGLWLERLQPPSSGLKDAIHPNALGQEIICEALYYILSRDNLNILWPFFGRYSACNYQCPYCYVPTSVNKGSRVYHTIEEFENGFLRTFGPHQRLTLYLAFGEPMVARTFKSVMEMVDRHPKWELALTSNISMARRVLSMADASLVQDGRMHINASFHPTETSKEDFLERLLVLRAIGIECPIVYVAYPPLIERLEDDIDFFAEHGFLVHVRRFRGWYQRKFYPASYSPEERKQVARFMDKASIRYMLQNVPSLGRRTFLGMHHILVDEKGDVELCDEYPGDKDLGNVIEGEVCLYTLPQPFPGPVSLGAVDDVGNLVELGYEELDGNHITSYARLGGVYKDEEGTIHYPYREAAFDPRFWEALLAVPEPENVKTPAWFLKHRVWIYGLERNWIRTKQFLAGKYRLWRQGKLNIKDISRFFHA